MSSRTSDRAGPSLRDLVSLARPRQWTKGAFVLVGPVYGLADGASVPWLAVLGAVLAFGFASSGCYVVNDIRDRAADSAHPRKRNRPIASGAVPVRHAWAFAVVLVLLGALASVSVGFLGAPEGALWLGAAVGVYVVNTVVYSYGLKHAVILDVISLAVGFVLRVLGGCAAAGVSPSSWLLNCIFFVSMFLAFGKRLGERRTTGVDAATVRAVQQSYTDELLRMAVVVTAVAVLVTYAGYVQSHEARFVLGFNLLWLTMLPATYGLLRCIVLLERGAFDDPTELATHDRPFQVAVVMFAGITLALVLASREGWV